MYGLVRAPWMSCVKSSRLPVNIEFHCGRSPEENLGCVSNTRPSWCKFHLLTMFNDSYGGLAPVARGVSTTWKRKAIDPPRKSSKYANIVLSKLFHRLDLWVWDI
jgi:hypothetical protein